MRALLCLMTSLYIFQATDPNRSFNPEGEVVEGQSKSEAEPFLPRICSRTLMGGACCSCVLLRCALLMTSLHGEGRSFNPEPSTDESRNLIAYLKTLGVKKWLCHVDQHEVRESYEAYESYGGSGFAIPQPLPPSLSLSLSLPPPSPRAYPAPSSSPHTTTMFAVL